LKTLFVTGGCGFIGSAFILKLIREQRCKIVNIDSLTYAGNADNLAAVAADPNYQHLAADICDEVAMRAAFQTFAPYALVNFAAETHVDRSILSPRAFLETNVMGTFTLLEAARAWRTESNEAGTTAFKFLHVSTDEVYGSLEPDDEPFSETTPYAPNSPYAASKAASDHLVRSYGRTFGLPVLITNCSNNYGPRQFPEKLVPFMITRATSGASMPIYGDGMNVRDWLFVEDHCDAIWEVLTSGRVGETYNIGGGAELTNREMVAEICNVLDRLKPRADGLGYASQIEYVKDRPGHDRRYSIDSSKVHVELGWRANMKFGAGLEQTVRWYLSNQKWVERITSGAYRDWVKQNYVVSRS
jgi:dTDP-glucose 4,6-dehydratase